MANYVRAELYKVFHREYVPVFILTMVVGEALLVSSLVFSNTHRGGIGFSAGVLILVNLLGSVGLCSTPITGDMVFSEQYKFNTLKNEVSCGLPRARIYLGKLLAQCVVALLLCAVSVAAYVAMCFVALPHDPAADGDAMQAVGYCLLVALPLWLGAQALVNMLYFMVKSSAVGSILAVGLFVGAGPVFSLIGMLGDGPFYRMFSGLYRIMLSTPLTLVRDSIGSWAFFGQTLAIGAGWFAVTTALGLLAWRRREIS